MQLNDLITSENISQTFQSTMIERADAITQCTNAKLVLAKSDIVGGVFLILVSVIINHVLVYLIREKKIADSDTNRFLILCANTMEIAGFVAILIRMVLPV